MHLVFVTMWLDPRDARTADRLAEASELERALGRSLIALALRVQVVRQEHGVGVTATMEVPDADRALNRLVPVLRSFSLSEDACILLRYGHIGAPERQVMLRDFATSASPTS